MSIYLHHGDIPSDIDWGNSVAVDTETMGLKLHRDRLCLIQLATAAGECHLVQRDMHATPADSPNLCALLNNENILKIFHFARFDIAALYKYLDVVTTPIYCTKIASKLVRTYTDRHGLKDLCRELLDVDISKHEQTSDWGSETLTENQKKYAASDVLSLHALKKALDQRLVREDRLSMAEACFNFLPYRAVLDLVAGEDFDIFQH